MKKFLLLFLVVPLVLLFVGTTYAYLLTFESLGPKHTPIPQTYGDIPNLDVTYAVKSGFGDTNELDPLDPSKGVLYWDNGYSDLTDVAWSGVNTPTNVNEIAFTPSIGHSATITGFDLGFWWGGNYSHDTQVKIYNNDFSVILFDTNLIAGSSAHQNFSANVTSNDTLHLQWLNPYYVAIDNVEYSVSETGPPNPVPEPTTLLLSGLGLLGMAVYIRRRSSKKA